MSASLSSKRKNGLRLLKFKGKCSIYSEGGFTLLELLTVIAIIGILAISLPSLRPLYRQYEIRTTANGLVSDINWAQGFALKERETIRIEFLQTSYRIRIEDSGGLPQTTVRTQTIPDGLVLTDPNFQGDVDYLTIEPRKLSLGHVVTAEEGFQSGTRSRGAVTSLFRVTDQCFQYQTGGGGLDWQDC